MKHRILTFIIVVVILAFAVVPAAASTPDQVTIVSTMTLSTSTGTFDASGPAVDAGVICPHGDVSDTMNMVAGYQSVRLVNLFIRKVFVCSDGSGSFEMNLNVHLVNDPYQAISQWVIVAGDGAYARLRGTGGIFAAPLDEDHLIDTYDGKLHID